MIQEGNIGLLKAIDRFDYTRGFKLISYAVWWIQQSINAYTQKSQEVRSHKNWVTIKRKIDSLLLTHSYSHMELAALIGVSVNTIRDAMIEVVSGNNTVSEDNEEIFSFIGEEDKQFFDIENQEILKKVEKIIQELPPLENELISMYFGLGNCESMEISAIAEMLNTNRETVNVRIKRIITKIQRKIRGK